MAEAAFTVRFQEDKLILINSTQLTASQYASSSGHQLIVQFPGTTDVILTMSAGSIPLVSNEYLEAPFDLEFPFANTVIGLDDISEYLEDYTPATYPIKNTIGDNAVITSEVFPDGEYQITFTFITGGVTYTKTKKVFNHDGVDRKILEKIDPTAGYYTQYKGSKEEHRAIDELVRIFTIREAMLLDYAKGYDEEAYLKLTIIQKYLRTCPVFKCNCAL